MMDSGELDLEMFGEMDESQGEMNEAPDYTESSEFQDFIEKEGIEFSPRYGYTQLKTFKPYYFNGQVVRGYAVFTLFNQVKAKDIYLRVRGYEVAGQHHKQALRNFKKTLLNSSAKGPLMSVQAMESSMHGLDASMSRGNTNLMNIYGSGANMRSSVGGKSAPDRDSRVPELRVVIQDDGKRESLPAQAPGAEQKIGARKQDYKSQAAPNAEALFPSNQASRAADNEIAATGERRARTDAATDGVDPSKSHSVMGEKVFAPDNNPNLALSPKEAAALASRGNRSALGVASNLAAKSEQPRITNVHNIDMRAQSGVFKDQKKFWLDQQEILDIYEKRFMNRSLADLGQQNQQLVFLQGGIKAYAASKYLKEGQYVLPFSFKLPENIPGTFFIKRKGTDGKEYDLRICYTIEVFIDTDIHGNEELKRAFTAEHEFEVREWLFTDDEVSEDVETQQIQNKVKSLFKTQTVLQPMFQGGKRDQELMDKLKQSDSSKFYEQLHEYFIDRGQPIQNAPWEVGHDFARATSFW